MGRDYSVTNSDSLATSLPIYLYLALIVIWFVRQIGRQKKGRQILVLALSFVYFAALGFVCFGPQLQVDLASGTMKPIWVGPVPTNPIPFRGFGWDVLLNVVLTLPIGIFLVLFLTRKITWRKVLLTGFLVGIGIELIQFGLDWVLPLKRWVDINDVLMNTLGVIIGWFLIRLVQKRWPRFVAKFQLNR